MIEKIMPLIGGIPHVRIGGMISGSVDKNFGDRGLARPLLHSDQLGLLQFL
jgi:hypothetical protein